MKLAFLVIALLTNKIVAGLEKSRTNETSSGIMEREKLEVSRNTSHGRLVHERYPRLRFVNESTPEQITQLINTSLRNLVHDLKGFISPIMFRFSLFQRKIEQFGSLIREIEGLINLGEHSEEAQQRLTYSKTLFETMTRAATNLQNLSPLTNTGDIVLARMILINLKALALHDSRGAFHATLAHSVRRILCLKQDIQSWEVVFNKLENVHFVTELLFSDLVLNTKDLISSLESKIPRDRDYWTRPGQPLDGYVHCAVFNL
ncbi:hypothetical protein OXX79_009880 [Metschnikowia pulcherrima]